MLSIPDPVKALFKRDNVRKNIRLTWENGRADITNAQLVAESLRFRESICSSDAIAFGTAEASTLEFETVGVENLFGLWLRAYIEVDASSLPADLQETRADLSFPVYSIPLGRFIVTACPRNHEALAHRKFSCRGRLSVAKSIIPPAVLSTALSGIRTSVVSYDWSMRVNRDRLRAYLGLIPDSAMTLASTSVRPGASSATYYTSRSIRTPFTEAQSSSTRRYIYLEVQANAPELPDNAIMAECTGIPTVTEADADSMTSRIAAQMKSGSYGQKIYWRNTTQVPTQAEIEDEIRPYIREIYADIAKNGLREIDIFGSLQFMGSASGAADRIYPSPAMINTSDVTRRSLACCPVAIRVGGITTSSIFWQFWLGPATNTIRVYSLSNMTDSVQTDVVKSAQIPGYATYTAELTDPLNQAVAMLSGVLESLGGFFTMDRYGQPVMRMLSSEPAARIRPAEYSSAWIEEQDLSTIGTIKFTLDGQEYSLTIGDGDSIYQLSNTEYWAKAGLSADDVAAALQADLVPALANLSYTPVDLEALGLPYIEAGDRIEIELEDGSTVQTYVLERNLEGIQHLTDSIIADGVTVQELEAAGLEDET